MIDADPDPQDAARVKQLETLDRLAQNFGRSLDSALVRGAASGRSLDGVLGTIGTKLAGAAARAASGPIRSGITGLVNAVLGAGSGGESGFARGGVFRGYTVPGNSPGVCNSLLQKAYLSDQGSRRALAFPQIRVYGVGSREGGDPMQGKLTALGVARLKTPGMYGDGHGLWLQVTGTGGKSWIFRYKIAGRAREMGLGSCATWSLAEARDRARDCRKLTSEGIDPIEVRRERRQEAALEAAKAVTFRQCAEAYVEAHKAGWRNPVHAAQWPSSLENHVHPVVGDLPAQAIDTALVMKVLEPIWTTRPETATRVRARIESVLDWAATRGYRRGENPARWKGHLQNLLPKRSKVKRVQHHPALPFVQLNTFMAGLRAHDTIAARALEFTILTAARSGETMGALWSEIDLEAGIWIVPAERMKAGTEHRVPLSAPALAILAQMRGHSDTFVFPSSRGRRPLRDKAMRDVLAKLDRADLTVHGFRSSFRDWAGECTAFPRDLAEMSLAHTVGDATERAYRRGDLFEKRRELMNAWATHCEQVRSRDE